MTFIRDHRHRSLKNKLPKGKKAKRSEGKKARVAAPHPPPIRSINELRRQRLAFNNIFEFAVLINLAKDDTTLMNRRYPDIKSELNSLREKLELGFEVSIFCLHQTSILF